MPLDPHINAFLTRLSSTSAPLVLDEIRAATEIGLRALQGEAETVAAVTEHEARSADGNPLRIRAYTPEGRGESGALPAIVFAHGGGWFQCSLDLYDNPCRALANATQCKVFSVDYRLAPENKFPVPVEDVYDGLQWVAGNAAMLGIDASRLAVCGDSAGGNLAAAVAIMARDRGGPAIAHQLLFYPVMDYAFSTQSYQTYGRNFFLTEEIMRYCWFTYLLNEADGASPYASPLRVRTTAGLPPATVLVSEYDPLRDEGEAYAQRLRDGGVTAHDHRLPGMVHACIHMLGLTPAARRLFDLAGQAMHAAFGERDASVATARRAAALPGRSVPLNAPG
ncbi:alpha/beta hydrolase [Achromobacter sp. Bel]|uniref:alpha/beta hydrolase n=1 Tax=Achromobacter sp. Bel TaxID=2727415 RepID=UPI00145D66B1|nr:alpha/beta hydrolase [Achromobacter sp. Bel]NMK47755.1 alpha/beta hydrolase [Achromobacter sp. Bel]